MNKFFLKMVNLKSGFPLRMQIQKIISALRNISQQFNRMNLPDIFLHIEKLHANFNILFYSNVHIWKNCTCMKSIYKRATFFDTWLNFNIIILWHAEQRKWIQKTFESIQPKYHIKYSFGVLDKSNIVLLDFDMIWVMSNISG